ncbi:MAG: hypothetical protein HXS46_00625 [Theionarchaea archaeon]|nr:hypothetical protein [Theionarchaea archaeon]
MYLGIYLQGDELGMFENILGMIVAIAGGLTTSVTYEILKSLFRAETEEETIEQRIKRLSSSLVEATSLIDQIEQEIKSRQALAEKLKEDIRIYRKLASLSQVEVEAVAQVLRRELRTESQRSFRKGVLINFVLFMLGAGFSFLLIVVF